MIPNIPKKTPSWAAPTHIASQLKSPPPGENYTGQRRKKCSSEKKSAQQKRKATQQGRKMLAREEKLLGTAEKFLKK